MRPKIILAILLIAVGVIAVAVILSKTSSVQPPLSQIAVTPTNSAPVVRAPQPTVAIAPAPVDTNAAAEREAKHEEDVRTRSDALMDLARDNDPAAHQKIVDALSDSDPAIRKAALDALEQVNDRSVIPQMQQVADQTYDPADKQAIEDAIDFIKLPSLTEVMKAKKAAKAAGTQSTTGTQSTPAQQ